MDTYVKEPNEETAWLEDEDEDMKEMTSLCTELGVEEMEQDVGPFAWGEEVLAHIEIDNFLTLTENDVEMKTECLEAKICVIKSTDNKLGVGHGGGVVNELANSIAYHQEGTWYLDRWIQGIRMISNNDQESSDNYDAEAAILSGTVLTNLRIVQTQSWKQPKSGWDNFDGLSILSKGWAKSDRLCEGRVLHKAEDQYRAGKRERGATGWWWPATRRSPGGTTSTTPRSRPSWPPISKRKNVSDSSNIIEETNSKNCGLWSSCMACSHDLKLVCFPRIG